MTERQKAEIILETACEVMQVDIGQVRSKCRKRELADVRKIFSLLARTLTRCGYYSLAGVLNKNHSTVVIAKQAAEGLLRYDDFRRDYQRVRMAVTSKFALHERQEFDRWALSMGSI